MKTVRSSTMHDNPWSERPEVLRRAFSLIELLIALALSVVLISAIYSAISLHWRYETLGRERIDRAQVSLAILRRLSEDVGSVMFTVPAATTEDEDAASSSTTSSTSSSTNSSSTSSGSTSGAATTSTSTGAAAAGAGSVSSSTGSTTTAAAVVAAPVSLGIVGTADYLQLDVSQPQVQDFVTVVDPSNLADTPQVMPSDLVRITWTLIRPNTNESVTTGIQSLIINPALVRDVVDRLDESVPTDSSENPSDSGTSIADIPDSSILAREVVSLQFRYYDGYSWVTEWDSTEMARLPRAIEITMGFLNREYRSASAPNVPGSASITTIKHVIQVSASTPVTGSEI